MEKADSKIVAKRCTALVGEIDTAGLDAYQAEFSGTSEGDQEARDLITSYRALLELEVLARDNHLDEQFRPKMWWMRGPYPGNFGDVLTPYVLWHAFGVAPRWTRALNAEGIAIGSIAKVAQPGTKVWGTGMPRPSDPVSPEAIWAAVRGPMSRDAVLKAGGTCPEIYGDPAVLLPELFDEEVAKTADVGIIAHVLQEDSIRESIARTGNTSIKLISLRAGTFAQIEDVVRAIKSCREIVSTSLHGVIVSHAYGVPCQSMRLVRGDDLTTDDSFKMRDYKMSVGLSDTALAAPHEFDDFAWLEKRVCSLPPRGIDTAALRDAFPFPKRI